jgi:HNH endonuclease
MGEAKRRVKEIGICIYCGSTNNLSKEHVLPYGLGGNLVLRKASCLACATETGRLEQRLLRGHWWPYRQFLGLPSRSAGEPIPDLQVTIKKTNGTDIFATLPMAKYSFAVFYEFDPPSILEGKERLDTPNAPRVYMKYLSELPSSVFIDGVPYKLQPDEKLEISINSDVSDFCRFLAKVAHGYAISRRGISSCSQFFLPPIILGEVQGALTFVGGASSPFIGPRLPGSGLHVMLDRINDSLLMVYIQLFRDHGDPLPIYEVVVGKVK